MDGKERSRTKANLSPPVILTGQEIWQDESADIRCAIWWKTRTILFSANVDDNALECKVMVRLIRNAK
jgi:hypothetical protein